MPSDCEAALGEAVELEETCEYRQLSSTLSIAEEGLLHHVDFMQLLDTALQGLKLLVSFLVTEKGLEACVAAQDGSKSIQTFEELFVSKEPINIVTGLP